MSWQSICTEGFDIAIVGATGLVGETLLRVLEERRFPIRRIRLLAGGRSHGRKLSLENHELLVEETSLEALGGANLVFFAATGSLSKTLAPLAAERGAVVIDKSSTWRMDPNVPLVVPEINAARLGAHRGIIACPNCTTIGLTMALEPLRRAFGLRSVVVTTLQAASGAGRAGIDELERQSRAHLAGEPLEARAFARPLAGNVIALCETIRQDGYSTEEAKLIEESRKILGLPELRLTVTAVRVPVPVGHSASVLIETEREPSVAAARRALKQFPGVRLIDADEGPTPNDAAGQDEVLVGRLRADAAPRRLWLWEVSDNLRKGAATNAVQIAETLVAQKALAV